MKLGMKQVTGINRVTLKKRDGLIFVISEPEVLKNATNDNSYAVFGELKLEDPNSQILKDQAKKFDEKAPKATAAPTAESKPKEEDKKVEEDDS